MKATEHLRRQLEAIVGNDFSARTYVVAVSGGQDSMALLSAMLQVVGPRRLIVGHFDHRTREGESLKDAQFVESYCREKGVECHVARRKGEGLAEASLRDERWGFLKKLRRRTNADFIVTAHHLQDQLETFLMRLVRGTGLEGLAAMAPKEKRVLRPWLHLEKKAVEALRVPFREDATNRQPIYFRNRVRHELLPEFFTLAEEYGGEDAFLERFAGLCVELQSYRRKLRRRSKTQMRKQAVSTPFWIRVRAGKLKATLVRGIYRELGAEAPSRARLAEVLAEVAGLKKKATLPGGVSVESSCGFLFFQNASQRAALKALDAPTLEGGYLECAPLGLKVRVSKSLTGVKPRYFKPGDRQGTKKLKAQFMAERIPAPERRLLPLLSCGESKEVAWYFSQKNPALQVESATFPFSFLDRLKSY